MRVQVDRETGSVPMEGRYNFSAEQQSFKVMLVGEKSRHEVRRWMSPGAAGHGWHTPSEAKLKAEEFASELRKFLVVEKIEDSVSPKAERETKPQQLRGLDRRDQEERSFAPTSAI